MTALMPHRADALWPPRRLFVQRAALDEPLTQCILARLPGLAPELVDSHFDIYPLLEHRANPEAIGKRWLYLARNTGRFFKPCPGQSDELACCGLWVLNTAIGCPLDCTYCFLQTYLPQQLVTLFVNLGDMERELDEVLSAQEGRFLRVCSGELSDSLVFDPLCDYSARLITLFAARANVSLELKTKTAAINAPDPGAFRDRLIYSWTLNAPSIVAQEERGAAPLAARLAAAHNAAARGCRIGFHFDPIIHFPGWEQEYESVIDQLFDAVPALAIAWISLGALRFDRRLKPFVQRRFPRSRIVYGEFIPGPDGKMRYPAPLRALMYRRLHGAIRARDASVPVYLCMESYDVWRKALNVAPACQAAVAGMLDQRLCGI